VVTDKKNKVSWGIPQQQVRKVALPFLCTLELLLLLPLDCLLEELLVVLKLDTLSLGEEGVPRLLLHDLLGLFAVLLLQLLKLGLP